MADKIKPVYYPRKTLFFLGFLFLLILSTITIPGCKTEKSNTNINNISDNTAPVNAALYNTIPDTAIPDDGKSFPLSFSGTWKKDNFNHTLTFTQDTLKASNQSYTWSFLSVSGDVYKIKPSNYNYTFTLTIKLNNGNLEISGDTAVNSENNWNGTWKKQ
jgi:hypothetical protein